jgi:hypothetical protein
MRAIGEDLLDPDGNSKCRDLSRPQPNAVRPLEAEPELDRETR